MRVFTVGHGTSSSVELSGLLTGAGVAAVADVRRFPGSRKHPHMGRDAMAVWLPEAGIDYAWMEDLGGRRRIPAGDPEVDTWWRVDAFRAYAAYTRTPEFRRGFARLLELASAQPTAVMCSESVWWRCHRRIIADVLVIQCDVEVLHLMPGGQLRPHTASDGARMADGSVFWDGC